MGIDINFFTNPKNDFNDVRVALQAIGATEVEYKASHTPSMACIHYKYKNQEKYMTMHFNVTEYMGLTTNMLSSRNNELNEEIFERLAKMFGGILQRTDCTDDCEMFDKPGNGNLRWMLDRYYASNENTPGDLDEDLESFINYCKNNP